MFWYNVINHNPSYYLKMYISERTNFLVNCIIMNFHQIFNCGKKKTNKRNKTNKKKCRQIETKGLRVDGKFTKEQQDGRCKYNYNNN